MTNEGLLAAPASARIRLPGVTMCAASSCNVEATIQALLTSLTFVNVAETILFTDAAQSTADIPTDSAIRIVRIERMNSAEAYSDFLLKELPDYVGTSHCLIIQWDGHIIEPAHWRLEFLEYDYIGARWPQFDDGHDVGNGGFSLRSKRLMEAARMPGFDAHHPEDVAICRTNRVFLESQGLRFAPAELADRFSAERSGDPAASFGYHGVFLMPQVLGTERFWRVYCTLDDRSSLRRDYGLLLGSLRGGTNFVLRSIRMAGNWFADIVFRRC